MLSGHGAWDSAVEADGQAASEGDMEALERLYDRYNDKLHRWFCSRTRGNTFLADDLTGETWLKVAAAIPTYGARGHSGFPGWLWTIARNTMTNHYRSVTTRREHLYPTLIAADLDPVDPAPGPETRTQAEEAREQIAAAVAALPASQRQVVILHHWGRLTLAETAAVMCKTPGATAMLHQRATHRLSKSLIGLSPRNFDASILVTLTTDSGRATETAS